MTCSTSAFPPLSDSNSVREDEGSVSPSDEDVESLLTLCVDDGLQFPDEGQKEYKSSLRPRVVCRTQAGEQLTRQFPGQDYSR